MLLFIDNFDSFTYSIVQYFQRLGAEVRVIRAQSLSVEECLSLRPQYIVIGPGPGSPTHATLSKNLILHNTHRIPILGICLGHQAIAECFGGKVTQMKPPMHGKTSSIFHSGKDLFQNIPQGFTATRYHSLIVEEDKFPDCLEITAKTEHQEIMALQHRYLPLYGVQFHPESILTEYGLDLLNNFLNFPAN